jgi:hypothetical protein
MIRSISSQGGNDVVPSLVPTNSDARDSSVSLDVQATPDTPKRLARPAKQHTQQTEKQTQQQEPQQDQQNPEILPRNVKILASHMSNLLDGVQKVGAGFYGEQTKSKIIESTKKIASVGDTSNSNIEQNLNETMSTLMTLQVKQKSTDDKIRKIVQDGKVLDSFLYDLRNL